LLLGFNRPDKMRQMLEPLRGLKPRHVFVSVDGPRTGRPFEAEQCRQTQIAAEEGIDWPCEVHRLYRETNVGCRAAVSGAITWALSKVEEVVVIEDDCIVDSTFFTMCRTLLDRHRNDEHVFCVAAVNFQAGRKRGDGDYYASKYPHCWGWATWKRAWSHYEDDIESLRPFVESSEFEACHETAVEVIY
jgi:hypothetical protein